MSRMTRSAASIAAVLVLTAVPARAQSNGSSAPTEPATELGVLVGAASSSQTGTMFGGTAGWELNRWTMIEARGAWLERGVGADGFAADVGALINVRAKRNITPYVGLGYGLYWAAFDSNVSQMSDFYRRRMPHRGDGPSDRAAFLDPALRVTSGVDLIIKQHLSVRPEASGLVVWREGQAQTIALFGVRLGYRFDDNSVKPARR
jgi:hypothetical protein